MCLNKILAKDTITMGLAVEFFTWKLALPKK
jgi:hypothetical protein